MNKAFSFEVSLRKDLCRLAQFGANISDAFSCFILLPSCLLTLDNNKKEDEDLLVIGGFHSLSNDILHDAKITKDSGLIGWVARHNSSIHVSPFDRDSRILGIYREDQHLKSFIGIPVAIDVCKCVLDTSSSLATGIIACDSKKSFAFSKLQGKLLEDLAKEVSTTIKLRFSCASQESDKTDWKEFLQVGTSLINSLGNQSIEILRLECKNFDEIEADLGAGKAVEIYEQVFPLIKQALPPHFPICKLPNGNIIIVLDGMMGGFYENRIRAICSHVDIQGYQLLFGYTRKSFRKRKFRSASLEELISSVNPGPSRAFIDRGKEYEYCRA